MSLVVEGTCTTLHIIDIKGYMYINTAFIQQLMWSELKVNGSFYK